MARADMLVAVVEADEDRLAELERDNVALRRAIELLHRVGNLSRESLELEAVCYAALTGVTAGVGLGFNRAMLFFADPGPPVVLEGVAAVGPADRDEADQVWKSIEQAEPDLRTLYEAGLRQRDDPGRLAQQVRSKKLDASADSRIAIAYRTLELTGSGGGDNLGGLIDDATGIAVPVRGRQQVHGVLYADNCFTQHVVGEVTQMVFSMVADHTGRSIDNARHFEDVSRAARTDALTGLGHHGTLMESLARAVSDAHRTGEPLCLAMLDLDDFKSVNDTLGHPVGDRLLAAVSTRLTRVSRQGSVFRYGGEEFAVLLPGADLSRAIGAAERLRASVGDARVEVGEGESLPVTCSIGVAALNPEDSSETLLRRADDALLEAKRLGKNRVVPSA